MGQVKEVTIHKFICEDTVEMRIQQLQQKKLDLAEGVMTGARRASKLNMDDLKMLFGMGGGSTAPSNNAHAALSAAHAVHREEKERNSGSDFIKRF